MMQIKPKFENYQPSLEELFKIPMTHIQNVRDCFKACKSQADVQKVINMTPAMFGSFFVNFDDEYKGFVVHNSYQDEDGYQEDEYWFDYPEDWVYDEEEEEE